MEFEEYWENYGELHAAMCGGNIKKFAKEIWASAITNTLSERLGDARIENVALKEQLKQKDDYIEMQQADIAEMSNEIQRLRDMVMDLEREKVELKACKAQRNVFG